MLDLSELLDGLASLRHPFWIAVSMAPLGAAIAIAFARFLAPHLGAQGDASTEPIVSDRAVTRPFIRLIDYGKTRGLTATARH
jgi:hypothetical protein